MTLRSPPEIGLFLEHGVYIVSARYAESLVEHTRVGLDRVLRQVELGGDLFSALVIQDPFQNVRLPCRQNRILGERVQNGSDLLRPRQIIHHDDGTPFFRRHHGRHHGRGDVVLGHVVLEHPIHEEDHYLAHQVGDGKKLKIPGDQLLHKPHADIADHHGEHESDELFRSAVVLLQRYADHREHGREVSENVYQVYGVKEAIFLNELCRAVRPDQLDGLVVPIQVPGCQHEPEHQHSRNQEHAFDPFFVDESAKTRNDHKHTQRNEYLAEVCDLVCRECELHRL